MGAIASYIHEHAPVIAASNPKRTLGRAIILLMAVVQVAFVVTLLFAGN